MKKWLLISLVLLLLTGCGSAEEEVSETVTPPALSTTATEAQAEATQVDATATVDETLDHAALLDAVLLVEGGNSEALEQIRESGDTRFVSGLVDSLRYQYGLRSEIADTLNALTGQDLPPEWDVWVEWAGNNADIESFDGYIAWKANVFTYLDDHFIRFVNEDIQVDPNSRVEEIVWGGVRVDGIPALDNPEMINPEDARYLVPEERVFGVSINGDTRAYPARFLDWHEMFNDIVGGEPVSLAY